MFRGLRLRLTVLYLFASLALVALVAGGTYRLLAYYFQSTTDLALQYKMAGELRQLGAPLPAELQAADYAWQTNQGSGRGTAIGLAGAGPEHDEAEEADQEGGFEAEHSGEEAYDGELAAIFVLPLSSAGQLLADQGLFALPPLPDTQAALAAVQNGSDWRTVQLSSGIRVRLLSYSLPSSSGPAVLQVGRTLADQDRVLSRLLAGLLVLGGTSTLLLGTGSWWLAGRSLIPTQRAWQQQQAFVANASHELRTPLTLMRAGTEVALRGLPAGEQDQRALLDDVLRECDHMSRLVEDLLLLSRLDAGRLKMERQPVALGELVSEVQRQVGRLAGEQGVELSAEVQSGARAYGDPTRLRQVLLILLDNALRHTPSGGSIKVAAQPRGRQVEISVTDTGRGIAPEALPHVFERFYQAGSDEARPGENGGAGLGLAIAKALVEAQQGQIRAESQTGQGTRISLAFPSAPQA